MNIWLLYWSAYLICLKHFFFALKFSSLCPLTVFEFCLNLGSYFITVLPITALSIQIFGSQNSFTEVNLYPLLITPIRLCDFSLQLLS